LKGRFPNQLEDRSINSGRRTIVITLANLLSYLSYFGTSIGCLLVAGFLYVKFTPIDEIAEMRKGNTAAAIALGGATIGYAVVVYSVMTHIYGVSTIGQGLLQVVMWSGISLVTQIIAFEIMRLVMAITHDNWKVKIEEGDIAHGVFAGAFSLAFGILNAGAVS
jgi:putative membrane protein